MQIPVCCIKPPSSRLLELAGGLLREPPPRTHQKVEESQRHINKAARVREAFRDLSSRSLEWTRVSGTQDQGCQQEIIRNPNPTFLLDRKR